MASDRLREQLPDAVRGHWADTLIPAAGRPYARMARFERPIGWWLLLLPCWWSSALAAIATGGFPNLLHLVLFLIGAIAMRGAGCTYNDILDRNLDGSVERTRNRPLPSGQVSVRQALLFMGCLCLVGLAVLLCFNALTIATGFGSIVVVLIYPLMKRVIPVPQLVLGLAFNWGALVGWTAYADSFGLAPLLLYIGGIFWTLGYDTIYALQDIEDDEIVGIKSSAIFFGSRVVPAIALCYTFTIMFFAGSLWLASANLWAYAGLVLLALHFCWQVVKIDTADSTVTLKLFRSNRDAGLLLFAGLFLNAAWG